MWRRIKAWWIERRTRNERLLFRVFNGRKLQAIDPWQTWHSLQNDPEFDFERHYQLAAAQSRPEYDWMLAAICRAFNVSRFDVKTQTGLTDGELVRLLDEFLGFIDTIQKKTNDGPTLSPSSESTSSSGPAAQAAATS